MFQEGDIVVWEGTGTFPFIQTGTPAIVVGLVGVHAVAVRFLVGEAEGKIMTLGKIHFKIVARKE